ncbi:MAG: hypothetical protein N4A36_00005 [Candidatus Gracilibacteria bacterium]|jgi:hypothetical protein|nr:hypothetical protein [Candidatus Gracilibacteria bacterium]
MFKQINKLVVFAGVLMVSFAPHVLADSNLDVYNLFINRYERDIYVKPGANLDIHANAYLEEGPATNLKFEIDVPNDEYFEYKNTVYTWNTWVPDKKNIPLTEFNPPLINTFSPTTDIDLKEGAFVDVFKVKFAMDKKISEYQNVFGVRFFDDDGLGDFEYRTVYVDVNPHIVNVYFTKPSIINDGEDSTDLVIEVKDFNGCENIDSAKVLANLLSLGIDAQTELVFDSCKDDLAIYKKEGITTIATTGQKSITFSAEDEDKHSNDPSDEEFGGIDFKQESVSITVSDKDSPVVSSITASDTVIGGDLKPSTDITWEYKGDVQEYKVSVGMAADCNDGTLVVDWTAIANAEMTFSVSADKFSEGQNKLNICVKRTLEENVFSSSASIVIEKDITPPDVKFLSMYPAYTVDQDVKIDWKGSERGTYKLTVNDPNPSGQVYNYTEVGSAKSVIFKNEDLVAGENTMYIHLFDLAGNKSTLARIIKKAAPPPTMAGHVLSLEDNDIENEAISGQDFTLTWEDLKYDQIQFYRIYILPSSVSDNDFNLNKDKYSHVAVASYNQTSWTGLENLTKDSNGNALQEVEYKVFILIDTFSGQKGDAGSLTLTPKADDLIEPEFSSAFAIDVNTIMLEFSEEISEVDTSKISASGLEIDTSYNADGFRDGYRIDGKNVFIRVNTLPTDYEATDLTVGACAVRDKEGVGDLNETYCASGEPMTNANSDYFNQLIFDKIKPQITLIKPAQDGKDNKYTDVHYIISEDVISGTLQLIFTRTGGENDPNSPHKYIVPLQYTTKGEYEFTINAREEAGLVEDVIYKVEAVATDIDNNEAIVVQNTNWLYTIIPPQPPIANQSFSSPTTNTRPEFAWTSVKDAYQYKIEVSLKMANYTPVFVSHVLDSSETSWIMDPEFAHDGTDDDEYIWRVFALDDDGNPSDPSNEFSFVLDTTAKADEIIIKDINTDSAEYTNNIEVKVEINGIQDDVEYYLITEDQNLPNPEDVNHEIQTNFNYEFQNTINGDKALYLWLKDSLGNLNDQEITANIFLDQESPQTPVVVLNDPDAENGKTNNNEVLISITNDDDFGSYQSGIESYCIASFVDGVVPNAPNATDCSTSKIQAESSTGWITAKPQSIILLNQGVKNIYVWTKDNAQNISEQGSPATIEVNKDAVPDIALKVSDSSSASTEYTNELTVDLEITNDDTAWRWCVKSAPKGSAITAPTKAACEVEDGADDEGASGWLKYRPYDYTFIDVDGNKTVSVWIKNAFGTISNSATQDITLDTVNPQIAYQAVMDLDNNGKADTLRILMSESVIDQTVDISDFKLEGFSFDETFTGAHSYLNFKNGFTTGTTENDDIFFLKLIENTDIATDIAPELSYLAKGITDYAENPVDDYSDNSFDNIAPYLLGIEAFDDNNNAIIERVVIRYSEELEVNPLLASDIFTLANSPTKDQAESVNYINDTIELIFNESGLSPNTGTKDFLISLNNAKGYVQDKSLNKAQDFTDIAVGDKSNPILIGVNYTQTGDISKDVLTLVFSEEIANNLSKSDLLAIGTGRFGTTPDFSKLTNTIKISLDSSDGAAFVVGVDKIALLSGVIQDIATNSNTNTDLILVSGGVVINEIAWVGSSTSTDDEWIELRNMTSSDINLAPLGAKYCLYINDQKLADLSGTINSDGYYLVSHFARTNTATSLGVDPDQVLDTAWMSIPDSDMQVSLYLAFDGNCDDQDVLIDQADDASGAPFFGGIDGSRYVSMERRENVGLGTDSSNWYAAVDSQNFKNNGQFGTPKLKNVIDATPPAFISGSNKPDINGLIPANPYAIEIAYADDAAGVGIDSSKTTIKVDINGDGDFDDADEDCTDRATITNTSVLCIVNNADFTHGKHSAQVDIADVAENTATTSWDFWIDNFTFKVENADVNLGGFSSGSFVETATNDEHNKITITTYGAGFDLYATPESQFNSDSNASFPWHNNNTSARGEGIAFRVKQGESGAFGNYFNFNDQQLLLSKSKLTSEQLSLSGDLKTYVFYVQHYAGSEFTQEAGNYLYKVDYSINTTY